MPIYEYQCSQCGHKLESFEKMTDPPLTDCPICGQSALQKLISAAGFQLKGTGWYATDFRNKGKPATTDTAPTKENTATGTGTTTETKTTDTKNSTDTTTTKQGTDTK